MKIVKNKIKINIVNKNNKIVTMPASHEDIIIIRYHHHYHYYGHLCILNINYTSKNKLNKYINYFQF